MSASGQSLPSVLRAVVKHRGVQTAVALWVAGYLVARWLAHGSLPFHRPAVDHLSFAQQMAAPSIGMIESFAPWVHALGYHAVAPHVVADAPLVVRIFGIR